MGRSVGGASEEAYALVALRRVRARWQQRTTQQCIVPLGAIGPGPHALTLEVEGSREQGGGPGGASGGGGGFKVFGIYAQERRSSSSAATTTTPPR